MPRDCFDRLYSDVWVTKGREIADYYLEHYYDAALADIARRTA